MKRLLLSVVVIALMAGPLASAVSADPDNVNTLMVTLHCDDGRVLEGTSIIQNSGRPFTITTDTSVFIQMEGSFVDLDHPELPPVTFETTPGYGMNAQLITCYYDVHFTRNLRVTGEFLETGLN